MFTENETVMMIVLGIKLGCSSCHNHMRGKKEDKIKVNEQGKQDVIVVGVNDDGYKQVRVMKMMMISVEDES